MRQISVVRSRDRYAGAGNAIAFSQRRAAERYIERIVKRKWKEATDFEEIGRQWYERVQHTVNAYGDASWEATDMRRQRDQIMEQMRLLKDRGYAEFRANYSYNYGDLPYIEDVTMYRTLAEFSG